MKRIGEIAARLVANPVELVAAANQKRSTEFCGPASSANTGPIADGMSDNEGGGSLDREGASEPPIARSGEGPESNGNEKVRGRAPAVQSNGLGDGARGKVSRALYGPALVLVIDNGWRSVHLPPRKGMPVPTLRRPLLIVVGGRHFATDTTTDSLTAEAW